jgi:hypothetical protein
MELKLKEGLNWCGRLKRNLLGPQHGWRINKINNAANMEGPVDPGYLGREVTTAS